MRGREEELEKDHDCGGERGEGEGKRSKAQNTVWNLGSVDGLLYMKFKYATDHIDRIHEHNTSLKKNVNGAVRERNELVGPMQFRPVPARRD